VADEFAASVFNFDLLNFVLRSSEVQGPSFVAANVSWTSSTQLLAKIAWPFASGRTLVLLRMQQNGANSHLGSADGSDGRLLMVFTLFLMESIDDIEVRTSGYAMDAVWLTFRGWGFKQEAYTCMLMSVVPPLSFQEWNSTWSSIMSSPACNQTWCSNNCTLRCVAADDVHCAYQCYVDSVQSKHPARNVSAAALAKNSSTILCPTLRWPFASGHVVPFLLHSGRVIPGVVSPAVKIRPQWTHVTPQGEIVFYFQVDNCHVTAVVMD